MNKLDTMTISLLETLFSSKKTASLHEDIEIPSVARRQFQGGL